MKINWNIKYTTISAYTILTFSACIFIYALIFNFTTIGEIITTILSVTSPIIYGIVIAYLLNPVMMWIERRLKKIIEKKKSRPKLTRIISVVITMTIFLTMIFALCMIVIPQVIDSLKVIISNTSTYISNFEKWINELFEKYPSIYSKVSEQIKNIETDLTNTINKIVPEVSNIIIKITDGAINFLFIIKNFIIGLIVSIYFLIDKEHFKAQFKKIIHAILPQNITTIVIRVGSQVNSSIGKFMSGKIIDSIIIGCLCFICMTVMNINFAVLISVIIGITNIIPFFGPFIGAIISGVLLIVSAPKQLIPFLILILIIQQLDGNIIGPKILGKSTGLSAFWVLFSIIVGGGLFGFIGMVLGVPIFAVIYSLIDEYISYRLHKKQLSTNTSDYIDSIK